MSLSKIAEIAVRYWPLFWAGTKVTLLVSLTGTIVGLAIGLVVGSVRAVRVEPRDGAGTIYIEVFRGTPMMVQAVFLYYLLKPALGWNPMVAGVCII